MRVRIIGEDWLLEDEHYFQILNLSWKLLLDCTQADKIDKKTRVFTIDKRTF
jgi:hypothetical protein